MPFGPTALKSLAHVDLSQLREVPGFPGYFAGPTGQVFSIRELSPYIDKDGYSRVWMSVSGERHRKAVHVVMAMTFVPKPREGQSLVRHLDDNRKRNVISNLAWGTVQDNAADMVRNGGVRGENNPRALLTERDVRVIRELRREGRPVGKIARLFGVSKGTVKAIFDGRNWKHVG